MRKRLLSIGLLCIMLALLTGCDRSASLERDGKRSFHKGKYEDAAAALSAAITANPNRAEYYINYGLTLIALGNCEEALVQFDKAYLDKDMLIIRENNKRIYRGKGIAYYKLLQYNDAVGEFKKALEIGELSELNMDILYYMADSLSAIGSYGEAAVACTGILKIDKKSVDAYSKRANCYKRLGEFEKSLADYDKAINLEPDQYEHYFGKYALMVENKDKAGALEVLEKAEAITPDSKQDEYNLAKLHFYQEDYDTALTEFNDRYADGFAEANYYIGEIYRIKKDYAKAIYYYEYYIDSGEVTSPNIFNQIAICLLKTDQAKEALEYLEQGLLYSNAGILQILKRNEIIVYERLGKYEEAKQKMVEYRKSYPKDTSAVKEAIFLETRVDKVTE